MEEQLLGRRLGIEGGFINNEMDKWIGWDGLTKKDEERENEAFVKRLNKRKEKNTETPVE